MSTLAAAPETINPANYRFLQDLIYRGSGIVIETGKEYLLDARLAPIVRGYSLHSINELCALIRDSRDKEAERQVVESMTTNETYFFRDPAHYEAIRTVFLRERRELATTTRKLSFWSAASSTGQELYSLAMLLSDEGLRNVNFQLFGTDLSRSVVERARAGRYLQLEINRGLPAHYLIRHFRREGLNWQLNDAVRNMARFEQFDLRESMSGFGPFDLVFCRNVLIYHDTVTRRKILGALHRTLVRGGWLLLGSAEGFVGIDDLFERRSIGDAVIFTAR